MELSNEFSVAAPIQELWPMLNDIERVAPCVPGFKITDVSCASEGKYGGTMKVKVGAVTTVYDCIIEFVELDNESHRAVIKVKGSETRGQGGMSALVVSTLTVQNAQTTDVSVVTNVDVTGKAAQFGRGILADVSDRLIKQFVKQLEARLLGPEAPVPGATAAESPSAADAGPSNGHARQSSSIQDDSEPLDLLSVAAGPLIRRVAPVAVLTLLILMVLGLRSRRS
ncbi:MAG: SRPBCC family protein [Solirubrobacterales bacterium]|nr:SRPBCC family protein [Solirubrobacterales bacterium]